MKKIKVKDKAHLHRLIKKEIQNNGLDCNLNHLDVSEVTDMSFIFCDCWSATNCSWTYSCASFNGDISEWDTSSVQNMQEMFSHSKFNGDISKWNVGNVTNISCMFRGSDFNGDISHWNTSNVENMENLFLGLQSEFSKFNGDISNWDVSKVHNMGSMFYNSPFTGSLENWTPYNLRTNFCMFENCAAPIPYWMGYENFQERNKAIEIYKGYKKLDQKLESKSKKPLLRNKI